MLPGTGRGRAIIPMSNEEKEKNKADERQLTKNILTGKFAKNLRNQNTSLPPIKPEGEFAVVPFFKKKMELFRIEGLTRENFIDLRIVIHNVVNPHQELQGKTPAEEAGIDLELERNKLLSLINYLANR